MPEEHEVVVQDDWTYVAVMEPGGLAVHGAVCVMEVGSRWAAPDAGDAVELILSEEAAVALVEAILTALGARIASPLEPRN